MSTSTHLHLDSTAPAVIEWEVDNTIHYLTDPDPRNTHVTLESRFLGEDSGAFKICIPIQLKGVDCNTHVTIIIHPDIIDAIEPETFAVGPAPVHKKLICSVICLRFHLSQPLQIVVPVAAAEPLHPKRKPSGDVLDAVRSLARVTALSVYVSDNELPKAKLNAVCKAISQRQVKLLPRQDDLASFYGGSGAKIIDFSADSPPSYHELEPPPPMAPIIKTNGGKRRRAHDRNNSDEVDSRIDAIWAELIQMRKEKARDEDAHHQIHQLQARVEQLEKDKQDMRQELDDLCSQLQNATEAVEACETNMLEMQQRIDELEEQQYGNHVVDSDAEDRIAETVTDRVLDSISATSYNAKVTFERK